MERDDLVWRSLERAGDLRPDLSPVVYAKLFDRHPEMKLLFVGDRSGAARGEMVARVLDIVLDVIGARTYGPNMIACEIVTHEGYCVPPKVFGAFFAVVADAVKDVLGPDWTPEVDAAWRDVLGEIDRLVASPAVA